MAHIVLCCDPLDRRVPDAAFAAEADAARRAGLQPLLVDHDALAAGDMRAALGRAAHPAPGPAVYRGWMMRADAFARLHAALAARGIDLLTPPGAYAACHHLPEAHAHVGRWMPQTVWLEEADLDAPGALEAALAPFGTAAVTVKDWVKSQAAGYWDTACLIPDASDRAAVRRVTDRFRDLQGRDLVGGLVFRRLVELDRARGEWRTFVLDGAIVGCWPREGASGKPPPGALMAEIARCLPSPFATADLAPGRDGRWWLMETGDGQVSAFPDGAAGPVLAALAARLTLPVRCPPGRFDGSG